MWWLRPYPRAAGRMVLWLCLGKHRPVRGWAWGRMAVAMATVAGLKGAGSPARLVNDTRLSWGLLRVPWHGLGDDTESVWAGLS